MNKRRHEYSRKHSPHRSHRSSETRHARSSRISSSSNDRYRKTGDHKRRRSHSPPSSSKSKTSRTRHSDQNSRSNHSSRSAKGEKPRRDSPNREKDKKRAKSSEILRDSRKSSPSTTKKEKRRPDTPETSRWDQTSKKPKMDSPPPTLTIETEKEPEKTSKSPECPVLTDETQNTDTGGESMPTLVPYEAEPNPGGASKFIELVTSSEKKADELRVECLKIAGFYQKTPPTLIPSVVAGKMKERERDASANVEIPRENENDEILKTPDDFIKMVETGETRDNLFFPALDECADNVLKIPELYRLNFALGDLWRLEECPIGQTFWYSDRHAKYTKYLVRLHDDTGYLNPCRYFVQKTQVDLKLPHTSHVSFYDLLVNMRQVGVDTEEGRQKSRIWLDLRDFSAIFDPLAYQSESLVSNLMTSIGPSVTHLVFGSHQHESCTIVRQKVTVAFFVSFLLLKLPNLEYLAVGNSELDNKNDVRRKLGLEVSGKILSRLKTFRLLQFTMPLTIQGGTFAVTLIRHILDRSPNLVNIYGFPFPLYNSLQKHVHKNIMPAGSKCLSRMLRSYLVQQNLYLSWHDDARAKFLDNLTNYYRSCKKNLEQGHAQGLEELNTRTCFVRNRKFRALCVHKLSGILRMCKKSLMKLRLEAMHDLDPKLNLPRLENLRVLQLNMTRTVGSGDLYFFPPDLDFKKTFPNVRAVEIALDRTSSHYTKGPYSKVRHTNLWTLFDQHFPSDIFEPWPTGSFVFDTVQSLTLIQFSPYECMPRISRLFPNIRALRLVNELGEVSDCLPVIYKLWPKLVHLSLEVKADTTRKTLDSAFTGFPKDLCEVAETSYFTVKLEETWRTKLPIYHLTDLRLLRIIIRHPGEPQILPAFSPVSVFYGFAKMPKLKVLLGFNDRMSQSEKEEFLRLFGPVLPYVDVDR